MGGRGEALGQLTSANVNSCRVKAGEVCSRSLLAVLALGFSSVKSCWARLQSRSLGTEATLAVCLLLVAPAFLPCS